MTWTLTQKSAAEAATGAGTTVTPTLPAPSTAGNLLVAVLANASGTGTWTLPAGWVQAVEALNSPIHAEIWYYPANPGGISSVVCTSSTSTNLKAALAEFHTDVTSPTVTLNATGTGVGGTVAQVTVTTGTVAAAGDLAICCFMEHFTAASAVTWTDPASFTLIGSDTAAGGNHLYGAYDLSAAGGALSVTGKSSVASDNAHGWAGAVATFTASPPAAGAAGLAGAYLNAANMGVSTTAQAISLWQSVTSRSLDAHRVYFGPGGIPAAITADLQADAAAGRKAAMSLKPAYNPPTTADLDALNTFLASCKNAGLQADVALWHEPYYAGLTAAQYQAMIQFYAGTVRQYYPLVFVTSAGSVHNNAENSYYPGDTWVDKCATDYYCSAYNTGIRLGAGGSTDPAQPADSASPGKPFGLWEFNSSTDPAQGQTQAQGTAYFGYIQSYFTGRLSAGKTNADLLLFNSNSNLAQETVITSASDYRVALYQSLDDALSGGAAQVSLASQIDIGLPLATALATSAVTLPGGSPGTPLPGYPQLIAEAGFVTSAPVPPAGTFLLDDPVDGRLDSGRLGDSTTWTDISQWVAGFTITRPSTRLQGPLWNYQAGTAAITLDNSDGRFDPDNLAGPYLVAGVSQLTAMVPVRLRGVFAMVTYGLYSGFADGWLPAVVTYEGGYAELTVPATDAFKVLAGITLAAAGAQGAGELSGARVNRILAAAGWYITGERRDVGAGNSALQATTLGDSALNLMQIAADSEIGQLYVDGSGAVVFRSRHDLLTDARSATVQAVFGDLPGTVHPAGTELPYAAVGRASDDTTIANDIQATIVGGTLQEVTDPASVARYLFPRTYARDDLILQTGTDALNWAQWVLYISRTGEDRFESLTIDPLADPVNLWPQVLGREIGDRIQVWQRPPPFGGYTVTYPATYPATGLVISRDCFIAGISHTWDSVSSAWSTTWTLMDASKYGSFLTLDNPATGRLGENALAY